MPISKIEYDGNTLIDLTKDTVVANKLIEGYTAHDKDGNIITGTAQEGIIPSGTKQITTNGTYDVTQFASANVNVQIDPSYTRSKTWEIVLPNDTEYGVETLVIANDTDVAEHYADNDIVVSAWPLQDVQVGPISGYITIGPYTASNRVYNGSDGYYGCGMGYTAPGNFGTGFGQKYPLINDRTKRNNCYLAVDSSGNIYFMGYACRKAGTYKITFSW